MGYVCKCIFERRLHVAHSNVYCTSRAMQGLLHKWLTQMYIALPGLCKGCYISGTHEMKPMHASTVYGHR